MNPKPPSPAGSPIARFVWLGVAFFCLLALLGAIGILLAIASTPDADGRGQGIVTMGALAGAALVIGGYAVRRLRRW